MSSLAAHITASAVEERATNAEDAPVLVDMHWNETTIESRRDRCIHDLVAAQAACRPEATAVLAAGTCLTYGDLDRRANRLAQHLRARGVGPEAHVGVLLERSPDLVVALLAVLKAGGAYVPLDPAYPAERLSFMLADSGAPVLLTRRDLAARLPVGPWEVLDVAAPEIAHQDPTPPWSGVRPDNLAYTIYTSGSTGRPKGVLITHRNLTNLICWHQHTFAITPADRATQVASPAFDAAGWELWPYLTAGASVYLPDEETRRSPTPLRDWLLVHGITVSFLPTALAEEVMALEWPAETALRLLLTGGDALHHYPSPDLPFAVINNYGPTEYTVVTTSGHVYPVAHATRPPSIGRPIDNTQVYILDEELQPVPAGAPGELCIGGAGLARGYHNRPELTSAKFIPHPCSDESGARLYRTGDRACYLPDGTIAFVGRVDDQVQIRGYRVEPGEVAAALAQHPAVRDAAVVAREGADGDRRLVAYIVPSVATGGARPTTALLQEFLAATLPDYMIPPTFVALDALPLTPNGKVDRGALPAPDETNSMRSDDVAAPRSPIEERLAGLVASLLGLEKVGVDDNFFLLGGHSLLGTQLIARVRDAFGVEISLRGLFEAPTVAALSAVIEERILALLDAMSDDEAQRLVMSE